MKTLCKFCKTEFETMWKSKLFCSDKCQQSNYKIKVILKKESLTKTT